MAEESLAWLDSVADLPVDGRYLTEPIFDLAHAVFDSSESPSSERHTTSPPIVLTPPPQTPDTVNAGLSISVRSSKSGTGSSSRPPRRRIRPKIALDPTQPLTAQGRQRARVYVACDQCRIRKTRCDGAMPVCFNCRKRPPEVGECSYAEQPKRRGQDKAPRTRMTTPTTANTKKGRKRRRTSVGNEEDDVHTGSDTNTTSEADGLQSRHSPHLRASYDNFPSLSSPDDSAEEYDPFPLVDLDSPSANSEYDLPRELDEQEQIIPPRPAFQFTRDTWWDALLSFYTSDDGAVDVGILSLSSEQRTFTVQRIVTDLRALFSSSIYWVSFIHIPRFFESLLDPIRRQSMQPSLVLSALAVGTFAQSSEAEQGAKGRAKALKLLDLADGALQGSLSSGWVDIGLIQAAWLLVYFEMQSHPLQSMERNRSSMLLLDSLIRLFSLTTLDADLKRANTPSCLNIGAGDHPDSGEADFSARSSVPHPFYVGPGSTLPTNIALGESVPQKPVVPDHITLGPSNATLTQFCNCASLTLGHNWPSVRGIAPSWANTLMWPENVSEGEFRKEECRRLVWSSVMITASMNSYTSVLEDIEKTRLWIKNSDNYVLLYPGESLAMAGMPVQPNNLWTLYLRSMLLLHTCVRKRGDMNMSDGQRAQFAMQAWLEIDAIEGALNQHTCALEHNQVGHQAREMLFSSRMCVSHEFQRYIPMVSTNGSRLFYRDKAEMWLRTRMIAAERLWQNLLTGTHVPALDHRKPLLIYWFMSHVIKALVLWKADQTLTVALEASKSFARRLEYLMTFWPSSEQRKKWQTLRYELVQACIQCHIRPPDPAFPSSIPHTIPPVAA